MLLRSSLSNSVNSSYSANPIRSSLLLLLSCSTLLALAVAAHAPLSPLAPIPAPLRAIPAPGALAKSLAIHPKRRNLFSGIATWYGDVLKGHHTASGEIFDPQALTACHPTLPFGTLVRVINLRNRQSVVVRINDRGILSPKGVIDLSTAAAEQINMLHAGVAPVRLEIVHTDPAANRTDPPSPPVPAKL